MQTLNFGKFFVIFNFSSLLAILSLSSSSFSLDDFNSLKDLDSSDVLDVFDIPDAEFLLLLDEPFDMLFSLAFFSKHNSLFLKENIWF